MRVKAGQNNTTQISLHRKQHVQSPQGDNLGEIPDEVLAERQKWLLLVVSEHLEHDRLGLDVVHERLSDIDSNLRGGNLVWIQTLGRIVWGCFKCKGH